MDVGSGVNVAVGEMVGVGLGPLVVVGRGVRVSVAVGGRRNVGVTSASGGYNSSMALYQSVPPVKTNSVKRAPAKYVRQLGNAGILSQP